MLRVDTMANAIGHARTLLASLTHGKHLYTKVLFVPEDAVVRPVEGVAVIRVGDLVSWYVLTPEHPSETKLSGVSHGPV